MNEQQYAGFWVRVGASIIDTIMILMIIAIPLTVIYGLGYWTDGGEDAPIFRGVWDAVLNNILPMILILWFWHRYGATPGKMILGLKIVDAATGDKMTVGQEVGRYFAYIPAILFLGLGLIWVGFDKRKQGWHDKLAGTIVVRQHLVG